MTIRKKNLLPLLASLIPVSLYALALAMRFPYGLSQHLARYSFLYFLIVLALYYLAFWVRGRLAWLAGACLTALVFGMGVSFLWNSGYSTDMIIGGLLPYRDAFSYYNGAHFLADGHLLAKHTNGAAWRPLFTSFLSSLLWLTGQNLMWSIALIVGLLAAAAFLSAWLLRNRLGAAAAAFYLAFIYLYIQSMLGFLYTEPLGLALGCLGFILVFHATQTQNLRAFLAGLAVLVVAVSVRAGAFFIFPALALWAGWGFRKGERYSFRAAGLALAVVLVVFLLANTLYARLVVEPGNLSFGNFAFTIYGQVVGGAGYNYAYQNLGLREPALIYRAAWQFFLNHPLSFFIGAAKAYRDFFFPDLGIFGYYSPNGRSPWDYVLWLAGLALTAWGLVKSARKIALPLPSLFLAAFAGILLSIPFLPPIDGGVRTYASTVPFIFIFPALAVGHSDLRPTEDDAWLPRLAGTLSILVIFLASVVPVLLNRLGREPAVTPPACPAEQVPYAVELHPASFIDLVPAGRSLCGHAPQVCLADFQANSWMVDASDAQVYNELMAYSASTDEAIRLFPAHEITSGKFYLFMGKARELPPGQAFTGCATEILIEKRPSIYRIETVE
jgi:hypothetical protein